MTANVHGRNAQITIGTNDFSPYASSITLEAGNDVHDITTYGNTAHRYLAGLTDGKLTVGGFWNVTATVGSEVVIWPLIGDSDGAAFVYGPNGSTTGNVKYTGTLILDNYTVSSPVADMVTFQAQFKIDGAVTKTVYP